jgi:hypothetical protein
MSTSQRLVIFACGALLFPACSLTVPALPHPDHSQPSPAVVEEHAPAGEIWSALADAIESRSIDTTTRLAQYVAVLARHGELSTSDVAKFDASFPGILRTARPLTEADVVQLRSLK